MIRLLVLGAALLGGGVLLKAAYDSPTALSVDDAVSAVRPTVQAAGQAADSASHLAGTLSSAADMGMAAAKDTASMLSDAVDAGARLVGVSAPTVSLPSLKREAAPVASKQATAPVPQRPPAPPAGKPAVYEAPTSRASAIGVLPLEQVVPGQGVQAESAGDDSAR